MTPRTRSTTARRAAAILAGALLATASLPAQSGLEVRPAAIDFGEQGQNARPEATLELRNRGMKALKIGEEAIVAVAPDEANGFALGSAGGTIVQSDSSLPLAEGEKDPHEPAEAAGSILRIELF